MTIRPLTEIAEFEQCVELSRDCFGMADVDLFPKRLYVVLNSIGGLVLGALDGDKVIQAHQGHGHTSVKWITELL